MTNIPGTTIFEPPAPGNKYNDQPSQAVPVNVPTATGAISAFTAPGEFLGYSLVETGGSNPVTVTFTDHNAATPTVVAEVVIAKGTSAQLTLKRGEGIKVSTALYITVTGSGALAGCVYS